ncbi:hypothetical protein [Floccifex sp.]|uniref:hypothetical protein n=1 Tax=Floccifex sp. TaxID=2815810 RepID=UPI002A75B867|nr:hypothetical protein [Floccifex sp.]MDD7281073.1 hypothetical protein [Erysipelotrichaceae bacterium]MDY2957343.1 hypothetical protein [Floccifex sp.]
MKMIFECYPNGDCEPVDASCYPVCYPSDQDCQPDIDFANGLLNSIHTTTYDNDLNALYV